MSFALNLSLIILVLLLIPTVYAGLIGAPYVPSFRAAFRRAFDRIKLGHGDLLVDLGAGDGKVLIEAARRGARAYGFELSPILWAVSSIRALGRRRVTVRWRNFLKQTLPPDTTVVFIFLLPDHMAKIQAYLSRQHLPRAKYCLVYAFPFPGLTPREVIREPKCLPLYIYDFGAVAWKNDQTPMTNDHSNPKAPMTK